MIIRFHSLLATDIVSYLRYKRALGRKFNNEERTLRLLDRYLVEHAVSDATELQPALIGAFLASRPRHAARSFNHLLGVTRGFFSWLVTQERLMQSPVHCHIRRDAGQLCPFIFQPHQVQQLLVVAAQLPDNAHAQHRGKIYALMFRLIYGLGLRVGEVVRLRYCDVDMARALLVIDKSKFGKTRLVPFGPQMGQHIAAYMDDCVDWYGPWKSEDPLFSFHCGPSRRHPGTGSISQTFHNLLPKLGLVVPPGVSKPRLHCLRHSFAVATLLRWYRSGVDPNTRLFHLATFMGHVDPSSTAWYLTVTEALLNEANVRFERFVTGGKEERRP